MNDEIKNDAVRCHENTT